MNAVGRQSETTQMDGHLVACRPLRAQVERLPLNFQRQMSGIIRVRPKQSLVHKRKAG